MTSEQSRDQSGEVFFLIVVLILLFIPDNEECNGTCYRKVRFLGSACRGALGQTTEPQAAPDMLVGTLDGSHLNICMDVCVNYCKSLQIKVSA